MARVLARVTGTALAPGVSRNGRQYTRENIAKAVARAQARISDGKRPISMRSHHQAEGDSTRVVGRVTKMWQDPDTGAARYTADIADTSHGRDIAALVDDSDGNPQFLRGVSIRGSWVGSPRSGMVDGRSVQTGDDLEIAGLDYTAEPGVDDADVQIATPDDDMESAPSYPITESAPEALVSIPATAASATPSQAGADVTEAATVPMSKRDSGLTGKGGPWADPGYQADKKQRYQLDSKSNSKAAWSYINQKDNAAKYTANQLKRIKGRIIKALKKFGVTVNTDTAEAYLIDPAEQLTESTTLAECMGWGDAAASGSYYITMTNGPTTITISSSIIDPADLDLVGRAAMDGALGALATIDPDMDGDIDVPGAEPEDADGDMDDDEPDDVPSANIPGTACPCGCGCAIPVGDGSCPCGCGCDICKPMSGTDATEAASDTVPVTEAEAADAPAPSSETAGPGPASDAEAAPTEPIPQPPAPDPAADPNTEQEEPDVSEPTTPAVEPTPAAATEPSTLDVLSAKFDKLTDAIGGLVSKLTVPAATPAVESAPAAPAAEQAPTAPPVAAPAPAAPVTETEEQRVARLVAEQMKTERTRLVQEMVATGALTPRRRGYVAPVATPGQQDAVTEGVNQNGMPIGSPDKPLHEYSTDEFRRAIGAPLIQHYTGHYLGQQ